MNKEARHAMQSGGRHKRACQGRGRSGTSTRAGAPGACSLTERPGPQVCKATCVLACDKRYASRLLDLAGLQDLLLSLFIVMLSELAGYQTPASAEFPPCAKEQNRQHWAPPGSAATRGRWACKKRTCPCLAADFWFWKGCRRFGGLDVRCRSSQFPFLSFGHRAFCAC